MEFGTSQRDTVRDCAQPIEAGVAITALTGTNRPTVDFCADGESGVTQNATALSFQWFDLNRHRRSRFRRACLPPISAGYR
jgi:hypothetical protein